MATGDQRTDPHRPFALVGLAVTGVLTGAVFGALTNSINGRVSPLYFRNILRWHDVEDVWRAAVAQGIFEGLMFGLFLAMVFTIVVGCVSKARCGYGFGVVVLLFVAVAALVCWAVGGLLGMGLAILSPEFYRHAFIGVPQDFGEMLRYAWVGGSIWGIEFGGFALTVLGSFLFYARWQRRAIPPLLPTPSAGSSVTTGPRRSGWTTTSSRPEPASTGLSCCTCSMRAAKRWRGPTPA